MDGTATGRAPRAAVSPRRPVLPAGAVTDANLQRRDLQVIAQLSRYADDTGRVEYSLVRLARDLGCSPQIVQRTIERLIKLGYLELRILDRTPSGRRACHLRVPQEQLERFIAACLVAAPGERLQSNALYQAFCTWAQTNGEREWSHKTLSLSLLESGFQRKQSNVMWWLDWKLGDDTRHHLWTSS